MRCISRGLVAFVACWSSISARADERRESTFPLTLVYDRKLDDTEKSRSVAATLTRLDELGLEIRVDAASVERVVEASDGGISAERVDDAGLVYDALYHLLDLSRLPRELYPLFGRLLLVDDLRVLDPRTGKLQVAPLGLARDGTILVDHESINQLEMFGNYMHPKVNFAMILELGIEARLRAMGDDVLSALGLKLVVDDDEWVQLNGRGSDGWDVYTGEELAFVGLGATLRVTPPGLVYDAIRELSTGVPADAYAGLPDAGHPWWSPRHSPVTERQSILRCMFSRSERFFQRLSGARGVRADPVLREKTRLILYAAFVASGGVLEQGFWRRRHPGRSVVVDLTRDLDDSFRRHLNTRLEGNPRTKGQAIEPPR